MGKIVKTSFGAVDGQALEKLPRPGNLWVGGTPGSFPIA
jgi:hypothetical protein